MTTIARVGTIALMLTIATTAMSRADEFHSLEGWWKGALEPAPGQKLTILFRVECNPGVKVWMDSPDQGAFGIEGKPLGKSALEFPALKGSFTPTGPVGVNEQTVAGTWKQGGGSLPLTLTRITEKEYLAFRPQIPAEAKGIWQGTLDLPGAKLKLVFRVEEKNGQLAAFLDSPDQGANGIPVSKVTLSDGVLRFEVKAIAGSFEGKANADATAYEGQWSQGGAKLPLTLKKGGKIEQAKRPQEPKPPFPYAVQEVAIVNPAASDVTLAGTLTIPEGAGPFPAVALVSGSGPQDRDETLLGHKPFAVLADALTRRGIAVLRYDDRGVGKSTGQFDKATSADFATDALAAIQFLRTRKEVDNRRVGLAGHSEGGLIAPIVGAQAPADVAFLVLLAGPGVTGREVLLKQNLLIGQKMGADEAELARQVKNLEKAIEILETEPDLKKAETRVAALIKEAAKKESPEVDQALGESLAEQGIRQLLSPWFRYFLTFDPRPSLAKVKCPVLVLNGGKDLQVDPDQNVPEVVKALESGGNAAVTSKVFPNLNHLFQTCESGAPAEYARIEETMSPEVLTTIADWILALPKS